MEKKVTLIIPAYNEEKNIVNVLKLSKEYEFIDFLCHDSLPVGESYHASWSLIQESFNSLMRHSNFHIFFKNNVEYLKKN